MTQDEFELARLDDAHSLTAAPPGQTDPFKALPERQFEDLVSVARLVGRSRGAALRFWCGGRAWTGAAIGVTEEELARLDFAVRVQACARPAIAFPAKNTRECLFALAAPLELAGGLAGAVLLIDDEPRRHDLETTAAIERIASALAPRVNAEADERLAAALLRGAPDAILSIRADLGIDYRNQSAEKLFGETVTTRPAYIDVIFPEDVREASRRRLADSIATLGPGQAETMQFVGLRADGRVFPMELTLCAVPDAVYGRLSLVVRDCTQRFAAESALKAAKSAAEAASRAKTSFLANISHELQTPLNGVIGLLDGLDLSTLTDRQAEAVGLALASGRDLQSLVADVLELTRLESDAEPVRAVDFDLPAFGASLASAFAEAARRKGLDLKVEIAPEARLRVSGDADKLGRMLARLLDNAIKFTAQGHVRLAISRASPTHFSFEVSDSGVGFAADIAPRLFNAFEQAELGLTRRFSGAGLGLALCREIADLLGAEISCGSAPGCGAEFRINVPLDVEGDELAEPSVPFRTEARAPGRPLRVLIADDNAVNRQVLEAILATVDAEVAAAGDGAEALDAVRRELFDLILMDMMMPVMDGLSATRAIRSLEAAERRPRTPVIMVSANTLPEHIDAARLAGVDHYLTKPVGARQLLEAVAELLAEPMMAEPLELAQAS